MAYNTFLYSYNIVNFNLSTITSFDSLLMILFTVIKHNMIYSHLFAFLIALYFEGVIGKQYKITLYYIFLQIDTLI